MEESGNLELTAAAGTSPAQVAANRANALLSTGPKTEQGKYRSRLNATTHGLTGRIIILTGEELSKYQTLHREFAEFYKPVGPEENGLVRTIADCQWRLDRSMPIEQGRKADAHQVPPAISIARRKPNVMPRLIQFALKYAF